MEAVRQWLLSVTAAALVLALAEALAPEGGAKRVCRLAGGLALVLAAATYGYDEDGVPCPWEVTARGAWTQEQRERLERLLEEELGVPAQRQHYEEILP